MIVSCGVCHRQFTTVPSAIKSGRGKFCSLRCSVLNRYPSSGKTCQEVFHDSYIEEPNSGCFLWLGRLNTYGYAMLSSGRHNQIRAGRFSLQIKTGLSGDGMMACHTCDMPACVNPDHLFWGTSADNHADASRKGRLRKTPLTHCQRGHEFTPANTVISGKYRRCRECQNMRPRLRRAGLPLPNPQNRSLLVLPPP